MERGSISLSKLLGSPLQKTFQFDLNSYFPYWFLFSFALWSYIASLARKIQRTKSNDLVSEAMLIAFTLGTILTPLYGFTDSVAKVSAPIGLLCYTIIAFFCIGWILDEGIRTVSFGSLLPEGRSLAILTSLSILVTFGVLDYYDGRVKAVLVPSFTQFYRVESLIYLLIFIGVMLKELDMFSIKTFRISSIRPSSDHAFFFSILSIYLVSSYLLQWSSTATGPMTHGPLTFVTIHLLIFPLLFDSLPPQEMGLATTRIMLRVYYLLYFLSWCLGSFQSK